MSLYVLKLLRLILLICISLPFGIEALQVSNLACLENMMPGTRKEIQFTLINDSDQNEEIDLKLVNYSCNSEGKHFFDNLSEDIPKYPRSNGAWIHLDKKRVRLASGENKTVSYMIEVPKDQRLKGSYWSVLLIEPTDSLFMKNPSAGFNLNVKIRYAHHIVVNIGAAKPLLKIFKKEVAEIEGSHYLCLHVVNEGELFFNPSLILKLYNQEGKLENTLKSQAERLYPGNSQCYFLKLPENSTPLTQLNGFLLFADKSNTLIGDKFSFP